MNAPARLRRHLGLLLVLCCVMPLYLLWTWSGQVGQFGNDGPNYLMMALHYSPYSHTLPLFDETAAVSRFPPLYPLMLAWAGAGGDLHWVHALTTLFLFAGLLAYYAWLLVHDAAPAQAALLVLLYAALPGSWLLGLSVQSEYLYLFWSLLALALLSAYGRSRRQELLYAAALAVSAATLTRTLGVTLYLPLLLAAWTAPRRAAVFVLVSSLLPVLAWHLLHRADTGYTDTLGSTDLSGFIGFTRDQLARELPALRDGFVGNFMRGAPFPAAPFHALGAICLLATLLRGLRLRPDAVYMLAYLLIVLFWPYPEEAQRFLWVILPLLLAQPLLLLGQWRGKTLGERQPRLAACALAGALLLLAIPSLAMASDRYRNAAYSGLPAARNLISWYGGSADPGDDLHRAFSQVVIMDALRRIDEEIPADACVVAIRPDLVNYFGRRRSTFPPPDSIPDPYFRKMLRATGCHFVFMSSAADNRFPVPLYPLQRLGDKIRVLDYVDQHDPPPARLNVACMLAEID
jgi:hypothetical protein